jgi:hypothetical protein
MNIPWKLLSADNCSHYKTMGWVTLRFSVYMKRVNFCQLPTKWPSIYSTVVDLPYNCLSVGFKGIRFSSVAKYQPLLSFPIVFHGESAKVTYLLNYKTFKSYVKIKAIMDQKQLIQNRSFCKVSFTIFLMSDWHDF